MGDQYQGCQRVRMLVNINTGSDIISHINWDNFRYNLYWKHLHSRHLPRLVIRKHQVMISKGVQRIGFIEKNVASFMID